MAFHSKQASSTFSHLGLLLTATAVASLLGAAAACSSDSSDGPATGGTSASGSSSGGTSSNNAGEGNSDAGKASNTGGSGSGATGGDTASGGMPDENGGTAAGGKNSGGSSSGGKDSGGSSSGGSSSSNLPGDDNWACVEAGGSCVCQNNSNPKDASVCTGTYKCCYAVPLGASTRCQCQDPGTSKCEDLAHFFGPDGKVVDSCPQK